MRDGIVGVSAAGSARECIKRLWKAYFADPSQWWDYREFKRNPKAPDFQHKTSKESLWLDGSRNPSWVIPMLEKRKQECLSLRLPTTSPEEGKKKKKKKKKEAAPPECVPPRLSTFSEVPKLGMMTNKTMPSNRSKFTSSRVDTLEEHSTKMKTKKKKMPTNNSSVTSSRAADTLEEHSMKLEEHLTKMKTKKKKMPTNSSSVTSSRAADTLEEHSMKMKKSSTIGRVCDWHSLCLEDAIDSLEKGSFSEPSIETLVYIVCKCTKKKDIHYASRLLAYLRRNGLDSHKSLGNYLVSMLVEVENMCDAWDVFDRLESRSECTWNALIKGYIKSGDLEKAITLYKSMRKDRALHLSGYTFVALLKACTTLKDVDVGRQVHVDIAREGLLKTNLFVCNALLDMYAKCGSLLETQKVFDRLPVRDVVTWTSLIAGYAQQEQGAAALRCFEQMQGSNVAPNAFTFACILKACGSLRNSIVGREVHAKVEEEGFLESSQFVGNALVDMYAKCGMVAKAQEVFNLLPVRDVISWNALITGYVEHAHSTEALVCFKRMRSEGVSPNAITFACILKACASARAIQMGREIHLEIVRKRLLRRDLVLGSSLVDMYAKCGFLAIAKAVFDKLPVRDTVTWTALIAGYAQHDAGEKALVCFKQMRAQGVSPDAIAYACSLKACGSIGATNIGTEIHAEIDEKGLLKRDLPLANAVIDMYTKCGMIAKAQEVFVGIPVHDVVSWTALMTGYAHLGDVEDVLRIFDKMREDCVNPTPVTTLTILNACGNAGLVDTTATYLEAMNEMFGIIPTLEHHTCVVDLLGRVGQLDRAVALVAKAPFHPNVVMWLTLLGACQKWGHVGLAREAFEQVMLLDDGEASAYICMSNIYADAGMHKCANKVDVICLTASLEEA